MGAYLQDAAAAIGVDPGFLIGPMLAVLAGTIGNSRCIVLKRSWSEPAVIWATFLAASGERKSPSLDHAKRHLDRIHAEAVKAYLDAKEEYEQARRVYEEDMRAWR